MGIKKCGVEEERDDNMGDLKEWGEVNYVLLWSNDGTPLFISFKLVM